MNELQMKEAASKFKTPFYVFDSDVLNAQVKKIKDALQSTAKVCYAMKANPFIIAEILDTVDCFEVCSPGEFRICERANIPMEKIVMSGVYKNKDDIHYALDTYKTDGVYTVESYNQWVLLSEYAAENKMNIKVLLRLSNGNQFGMDKSVLESIVADRENHPYIHIEGVQYFTGTQKKPASKIEREIRKIDALVVELKEKYGFESEKIEYGPGLPICYFDGEENVEDEMLQALCNAIKEMQFKGEIVLEMGRYIAAYCGYYFTKVVDEKVNKSQPYCIIDGGVHHVNYYGQMMAMKMPPIIHLEENKDAEEKNWSICGSLCTVNDVLVKAYPFKDLKLGDTLVFKKTGAYSSTEGISLLLSRDLPQIIVYSQKDGYRVARTHYATDIINYFQN